MEKKGIDELNRLASYSRIMIRTLQMVEMLRSDGQRGASRKELKQLLGVSKTTIDRHLTVFKYFFREKLRYYPRRLSKYGTPTKFYYLE